MSTRYREAIADTLVIEPNELLPLVTLRPDDPMVRYDHKGRVLLLNVHCHPESFQGGAKSALLYAIWTFTDKEFLAWLKQQDVRAVDDWTLRLNQLLGMPAYRASTHVSGFWVKPQYVIRPAYSFDVFTPIPTDSFSATAQLYAALASLHESVSPKEEVVDGSQWHELLRKARAHGAQYRQWFDHQVLIAYGSNEGYPWTRLGYTYDWGAANDSDAESKYGLSEFMIPMGAMVEVAFTLTIAEFIAQALAQVGKNA